VEVEDDRRARIRFGDGVNGMVPPVDAGFLATQCVGNGAAGNIGPNAIAHVVHDEVPGLSVTNPDAASGGTGPELLSSVRLNAPSAFRTTERVVAADDYVRRALEVDGVEDATAAITSNGSWPVAVVYVHSGDWAKPDDQLLARVEARLRPLQPAGVDLDVRGAIAMPVTAVLEVALAPPWELAGTAEAVDLAIQRAFLDTGSFHFGTALHRSELVTVVAAVPGVVDVSVAQLRWTRQPAGEPAAETLLPPLGRILRIDNDPRRPRNGSIGYELGIAVP
jgi:predicted phage baseplate assembly protein